MEGAFHHNNDALVAVTFDSLFIGIAVEHAMLAQN